MLRPLLYALVPLLLDSLGVIVFAILLALHMALVPATIVGAVVGCAVVAWEALRHRRVPALQWVSLALILFSAGAVMLSGDARFVMVKPSIIYAVVGLAMLRRGWMNRYVSPEDLARIGDLMTLFGFVWAALMLATAALNLLFALALTTAWPEFIAVFPLASKLLLFAAQFLTVNAIGRARVGQGL
ncbi:MULTISPECIES: septation protein IspZ [unclassified Sphingomonas]|uniref:septation protein IspZ n=1 Tax=unclassified Sphingomonas TaxID=196159 RepID=UPI00092981EF|nr:MULTISPECIES: septation protein IspZ [unclassified Sphingomonas]MBN8847597.1 septation protein IspZ [Sphingomonas sp.]OJV32957.1 MAG: intracellular septation protein [Sphingomonas sp. 67-36]